MAGTTGCECSRPPASVVLAAPPDVAFALFSFPSVEAYDAYRAAVAEDDACKAATARFNETRCFSGYERSFLTPIFD